MREVRVLHIASGDLWAGAEVQIYQLLKALSGRGDARLKAVLLNEGELATRLGACGVEVEVIDEQRYRAFAILSRLLRCIEEFSPDVLHTHRSKENILGHLASFVSRRAKVVRTVHGLNEHVANWRQPARWLIDQCNTLSGRYCAAQAIAVSEDMKRRLEELRWANVEHIPNGINVAEIQRCQEEPSFLATDGGLRHVGFVGRLVPIKRADIFVAIAERAAVNGEGQIMWHVFGDGAESIALRERVEHAGLSGMVTFHGHDPEAVRWLGSLDVLVMTSDYEGLPMVLLEAMAAGTPVVAHAVGGIKEVLASGEGGVLVAEQDPEAYLKAIQVVLRRGKREAHLGRQVVAAKYSIERTASTTLAVYRKIIGQ